MSTSFDDETLIAYLDGELSSDLVQSIEHELHADTTLQSRIHALQVTDNLLFELPDVQPNPDLAQSTIEMVTLDLDSARRLTWREWIQKNYLYAVCLASLFMLALGAVCGQILTGRATNRLLEQLPAFVEYRSLQHVSSPEWLERLESLGPLLVAAAENGGPKIIGNEQVPTDTAGRRLWVEELDEYDRVRLENNRQDFFAEAPQERQRIVEVAHAVFDDPAKVQDRLDAIRAYAAILDAAGTRQVTLVQDMSIEEKSDWIRQRVASILLRNYAAEMADEDKQAIRSWLFYDLNWFDDEVVLIQELWLEESVSSIKQTDINALRNRLSKNATELLDMLSSDLRQREFIGFWVDAVLRPEAPTAQSVSYEVLKKSFEEADEEFQVDLELMPEEQARAELRKQLGVTEIPTDAASENN